MGNYEQLKQSVSDVIKTNGNKEITGSILQNVLLTIISSVGANATFAGIATPTTNPGTPDGPVFWLASEGGTYSNFNAIELQDGLSVLMWNGSWNSQQIFGVDDEPTAGSDNLVKSGGVYAKIKAIEDAGYIFAGIATPTTNPGTPDQNVFYLAFESGTYPNFNAIELQDELSVLMWNGSWSTKPILSIDNEPTAGSDNLVKSGGIYAKIKAIEDAGYIFAGIATPTTNPDMPDQNVFYIASEAGAYTNFGGAELQDGLSLLMWNGSWSNQQIFSVDDIPTAGSDNLVKSGGVQEELALGAVYDVSAKNSTGGSNNDGKWESLSALLSDANLNTLIPTAVRKGGMNIKFVQSSDNKYVQYRLKSTSFNTTISNWVNVEDELVEERNARKLADTTLQADITNETTARSNADTALQNAISIQNTKIDEFEDTIRTQIDEYQPIVIEGNVTNAPDEEDLTSVNQSGTDVLKFKNRNNLYGMGMTILRRDKTFAEQLTQTNTIYVIRYDFTLGENITIPENCILKFDGGSISGEHTITGQNTGIEAGLVKIFDDSITLNGRWAVNEYHPEWFGAVTDDDTFDCTNAINKAIIMSGNSYGGVVKFVQGIYNFTGPINVNHKTSLIGSGMGTSILMQMPNSDNHGIYVGLNYAGLRFSNFSIRGNLNNTKAGIYFVDRYSVAPGQTDGEQKQYVYREYNDENYSYYPGYKYSIIDNVYIGGFNWGLYLGQGLFDMIVTHCTISENLGRGVIFMASDSEMTDCYINNNGASGLYVNNGPNKFSNLKVVFNALTKSNVASSAGIFLDVGASGEFFANCETQDNMCKGWHITGINNRFVNCMSETDGHIDDTSQGYQSGYNIYGFYINERIKIGNISGTDIYRDFVKTNVFTNCLVTNRMDTTKYDTPVKMVVPYPDIYEGIRIKVQDKVVGNKLLGTHLFVNPQYIPDYSSLSHNIGNIAATAIDGVNYFNLTSLTKIRQRLVTSDELYIYIAMRFDTTRNGQHLALTPSLRIDALKTDGNSNIEYRFVYGEDSYKLAARTKIGDADFVTLLFKKKGNSLYTSVAVKSNDTNDYVLYRKDYHDVNNAGEVIDYLETNLCLNKLVITNKPIDPTYIIPGSDLSNFRSDALVYISADSPNTNITEGSLTSGTFADKPTVAKNNIPVGYKYFCTDRQTTEGATNGIEIIHKGSDVWVDALGRVVS